MSQCPTCGQKQGSSNIVFWIIGICVAAFLAVPVMIVVLLASIAAVGASASNEFESVASQIEAQQLDMESNEWNTPAIPENTQEGVHTTP